MERTKTDRVSIWIETFRDYLKNRSAYSKTKKPIAFYKPEQLVIEVNGVIQIKAEKMPDLNLEECLATVKDFRRWLQIGQEIVEEGKTQEAIDDKRFLKLCRLLYTSLSKERLIQEGEHFDRAMTNVERSGRENMVMLSKLDDTFKTDPNVVINNDNRQIDIHSENARSAVEFAKHKILSQRKRQEQEEEVVAMVVGEGEGV